jgi:hypothetical protein
MPTGVSLKPMRAVYAAALLTLAASAMAQEIHDLRIVNGKQVDLAPIHKWLVGHEGQRPMKHWQQIQIVEVKSSVGTWDLCHIKNESGQSLDLYVDNMPPNIKQFLASFAEQERAIVVLRAQLARDKQVKEAAWNRYVYTDSSFYSVTSGSRGSSADTDTTRLVDAKVMTQRIEAEEEQLASLEGAYERSIAQSAQRLTTLAMFSGRKYGGLDIWDCGKSA